MGKKYYSGKAMALASIFLLTGCVLFSSCSPTEASGDTITSDEAINVVADPELSTWKPVALHDQNETVSAFVCAKDKSIIAGTSAGPYISSDYGQSWQKIMLPEDYQAAVFSLTADADGELYAGLSKYGVITSSDNGSTWELHNNGLNMGGPRSSYTILATGPHILKGTFESGIYLSTDKGKTWKPSNRGIPLDLNMNRMVSVTQLVKNDKTVYALTDLGVRYSTDNGKEWNKPRHEGIERLGYMLSLAVKGDTLYAGVGTSGKGVYYSVDNGENWVKAGLEQEEPYVLYVDPDGHLFAGTKDGEVYRSTNSGRSWVAFIKGLPENDGIYALYTTPDGKLLAGLNRKGIYLLE
jgi:photosystem II stability/assembly factor-like uncharacterized protein